MRCNFAPKVRLLYSKLKYNRNTKTTNKCIKLITTLEACANAGNNGLKLWVKDSSHIAIPTVYALYMGETTELMKMDDIPADKLINNIE
ncbi:hypothetical protein [Peribacillus sp. SCS-37]|uniref:hypothetical protein n=1 Tax=Paraperibacillus esterisolvens TaxID=3115296 RepID=UPI0039069F70